MEVKKVPQHLQDLVLKTNCPTQDV